MSKMNIQYSKWGSVNSILLYMYKGLNTYLQRLSLKITSLNVDYFKILLYSPMNVLSFISIEYILPKDI